MLKLERLTVAYPDFVGRYDLVVPRGALCAVVGPSGGGKTTLLSAIAGFETVAAGHLAFDGIDLLPLPPARRPVGLLFQEFNLFPHLTAAENVGLGLRPDLRLSPAQHAEVEAALDRVGLAGYGPRRPAALSGGQRQRVALARALAMKRPLLLLDEPFAALDPGRRRGMIALVDTLRRDQGLTVVMSIHTPEDVVDRADLIAFVDGGAVAACGPPAAVMNLPALDAFLGR
ncbi:MAG: thiamine ABC transporter ATP-binding protein [Ferrovibrionaceae bacterium]